MNYVSAKEAKSYFHINPTTLMHWKDKGLIKYKRFSNKKILYDIDSFEENSNPKENRINVIYARVSNTTQKDDLMRQIDIVSNYMMSNGIKPDKIYQEIASGMNEDRKELNLLIDDVINSDEYKSLTKEEQIYLKELANDYEKEKIPLNKLFIEKTPLNCHCEPLRILVRQSQNEMLYIDNCGKISFS